MAEFIKIPTDFRSLHDLTELVNNYDLVSRLCEALNSYQTHYLQSFFMTVDEVLKYIPATQHKMYRVWVRDNKYSIGDEISMWGEAADKKKLKSTLSSLILGKIKPKKGEKIFLVSHVKKEISVCWWNVGNSLKNIDWIDDFKYGKLEFYLDDKKILVVKVHYSFTDSQAVGGVMINGSGGYLSGHSYSDYTRHGYDIYHFCTKTNIFLGYKGCKQDEKRKWMKIKSRY